MDDVAKRILESLALPKLDIDLDPHKSLDFEINEKLAPYLNEGFPFNPLHVGRLLQEVKQRLAECERLRREAEDIEAETTGLLYRLDLRSALDALSTAEIQLRQHYEPKLMQFRSVLASNTGQISTDVEDTIASGFGESLFEVRNESIKKRGEFDEGLRKEAGERIEKRLSEIQSLFELHFIEAFRRSRCLAEGYLAVYAVSAAEVSLPSPEPSGYLQRLTEWVIKLENSLDRIAVSLVSFSKKFIGHSSLAGEKCNLYQSKAAFETHFKAGTFKFTIPIEKFSEVKYDHYRLRGISVENYKNIAATESGTSFWTAVAKAPAIEDSKNDPIQVPVTTIDGITFAKNDTEIWGTNELFNLSPVGEWEISIRPLIQEADSHNFENMIFTLHMVGWND